MRNAFVNSDSNTGQKILKKVSIFYDNDKAGISGGEKLARKLLEGENVT